MKRRKRLWIIAAIAVIAIASGGYYACAGSAKEKAEPVLVKVTRGTLELTAAASGTIEAQLQVDVKSRASGEIVEVTVREGDHVEAGDLLVRLDPADEERNLLNAEAGLLSARSRLAQAEASLATARADFAEASDKHARRRSAYSSGLISAEELQSSNIAAENAGRAVEQRDAEVRSSRADVQKAQLTIEDARKRLEETIIRAPVAGTILSVGVEKGTIVSSGISNVGGGTTLLTMADLSKLYVLAKVDEADIGSIKLSQKVKLRVDSFPNRTFEGIIERITPLGVNTSNVVTFDVRIEITDRSARVLLPGMTADVEVITEREENVLLLPSAAVHRERRGRGRAEGNAGAEMRTGPAGSSSDAARPETAASMADRSARDSSGAARSWSGERGERSGLWGGERAARGEGRRGARGGGDSGARPSGRQDGMTAGGIAGGIDRSGAANEMPQEQLSRPRISTPGYVTRVTGETISVTIGKTDGINVVILEGLSEGDEVLLSDGKDTSNAAQRASNPFAMGRPGGRR